MAPRNRRATVLGCMIILSAWLLLPGRNVAGNPWFEVLKRTCSGPGSSVVKQYQGIGFLGRDWLTVTYRPNSFTPERQIFFSYVNAAFDSMDCEAGGVTVRGPQRAVRLDYSRAANELVSRPLVYWDSIPQPPVRRPIVRGLQITIAVLLMSAILIVSIAKRRVPFGR